MNNQIGPQCSPLINEGVSVCGELALTIKNAFGLDKSLYIANSAYCVFHEFFKLADKVIARQTIDHIATPNTVISDSNYIIDTIEDRFDFIIGDIIFIPNKIICKYGDISISARYSWITILQSLSKLAENGYGLFLVEPMIGTQEWDNFTRDLAKCGFYINAYFNSPASTFKSVTSLRPIIILVSKNNTSSLFIAELDDHAKVVPLIHNLRNLNSAANIAEGVIIAPVKFNGFRKFHINNQIEMLHTQYKTFSEYCLSDICIKINQVKHGEQLHDVKNAVYIPKIGSSKVLSNLNEAKLKHHNYLQVILDESIVINEYVAAFYSSALGKLILESLFIGNSILLLTKAALQESVIAIPKKQDQETIISAHNKLHRLETAMNGFKNELSLNPKGAREIQDKIDGILAELKMLSSADQVLALIRIGESKTVEFKQTLSFDIKDKQKNCGLEHVVFKTIAAFLNTLGGDLLIGVDDNGTILGLNEEIKKFDKNSRDKFVLRFKDLFKANIGIEHVSSVDYSLIDIDEHVVLHVHVKPSTVPFFMKNDFFVRSNPATDKLEGQKAYEYIKRHDNFNANKAIV